MKFHSGEERFTILIPEIGIVIKLPRIYYKLIYRSLCEDLAARDWNHFKKGWTYPVDKYGGYRGWLFKGMATNWMEFWVYITTRNPFLQPTYFSLLGLVNIQKYGNPCPFDYRDLWCQFREITCEEVRKDGHHFSNDANFTYDGQTLRIVDYGNTRTRRIVILYGKKIVQAFDPSYRWKERLKK